MDANLEQLKISKKLEDAQSDIAKIDDATRTVYAIQKLACGLYSKLVCKQDYCVYIGKLKLLRNMGGKIPFERLDEDHKKEVLLMIQDAIKIYVSDLSASMIVQ